MKSILRTSYTLALCGLTSMSQAETFSIGYYWKEDCKAVPAETLLESTKAKIFENNVTISPQQKTLFKISKSALQKYPHATIQWGVVGPAASTEYASMREFQVHESSELNLSPDLAGGYLVTLALVQPDKTCIGTHLQVDAWVPRPAKPISNRVISTWNSEQDPKRFQHVVQVGADQAWKVSQGEGVIVAVLDSGLDMNHPEIRPNLADGGWNFVDNSAIPDDNQGHGTHVSGLIASTRFGVAPKAKILPLKVVSVFDNGNPKIIGKAIDYAVNHGAKVVNLSLGSDEDGYKQELSAPILRAAAKEVLIVTAAGNDHKNLDQKPSWPGSFNYPNVVTVGAIDLDGQFTDYSDTGFLTVDLSAPGGTLSQGLNSLFNLHEEKLYQRDAGTSMSSPLVAGAAALLYSINPSAKAALVKRVLMDSGTLDWRQLGKTWSAKNLRADQAVEMMKKISH